MIRPKTLTPQQSRLYRILKDCAEAGLRCPIAKDLAVNLRTSPTYVDKLFAAVEKKGWIKVEGNTKGRIVTILKTGKRTANIVAAPHWRDPASGTVGIAPGKPLTPGRYLLDTEGRLQPMRFSGFVKAVAIVTVKAKPQPKSEPAKADTARLPETPPEPVARPPRAEPRQRVPKYAKAEAQARRERRIERKAEDDEAFNEFSERLNRVQQRRAEGEVIVVTRQQRAKTAGAQLAAAFRARPRPTPPPPPKTPTERAYSTEECKFCGIPGSKGCAHFLPYDGGRAL
ncbi:MAG: hypothetical protein CMH85_01270 [Novosphingobium sp.]|nr:hypothetical protein [Novosphingobium sp.]